jgi:hypothetical protein
VRYFAFEVFIHSSLPPYTELVRIDRIIPSVQRGPDVAATPSRFSARATRPGHSPASPAAKIRRTTSSRSARTEGAYS